MAVYGGILALSARWQRPRAVCVRDRPPYKVEANVHLKGTPVDVMLIARSRLSESPALVEVEIPADDLEPERCDVDVWFDGGSIGSFPCEVGELERA